MPNVIPVPITIFYVVSRKDLHAEPSKLTLSRLADLFRGTPPGLELDAEYAIFTDYREACRFQEDLRLFQKAEERLKQMTPVELKDFLNNGTPLADHN